LFLEFDLGKLGHLSASFRWKTSFNKLATALGHLPAEKCGVWMPRILQVQTIERIMSGSIVGDGFKPLTASPMSSSSEWKSVQLYFEQLMSCQ